MAKEFIGLTGGANHREMAINTSLLTLRWFKDLPTRSNVNELLHEVDHEDLTDEETEKYGVLPDETPALF